MQNMIKTHAWNLTNKGNQNQFESNEMWAKTNFECREILWESHFPESIFFWVASNESISRKRLGIKISGTDQLHWKNWQKIATDTASKPANFSKLFLLKMLSIHLLSLPINTYLFHANEIDLKCKLKVEIAEAWKQKGKERNHFFSVFVTFTIKAASTIIVPTTNDSALLLLSLVSLQDALQCCLAPKIKLLRPKILLIIITQWL